MPIKNVDNGVGVVFGDGDIGITGIVAEYAVGVLITQFKECRSITEESLSQDEFEASIDIEAPVVTMLFHNKQSIKNLIRVLSEVEGKM